jgi:hypothetical protein
MQRMCGLKVSSLVQHHALASELLYNDVLIFSTRPRRKRDRLTRLRMFDQLNVTPDEVHVAELQGSIRAPLSRARLGASDQPLLRNAVATALMDS